MSKEKMGISYAIVVRVDGMQTIVYVTLELLMDRTTLRDYVFKQHSEACHKLGKTVNMALFNNYFENL